MMRPTKPSRVPSKSPTLMGRFFMGDPPTRGCKE